MPKRGRPPGTLRGQMKAIYTKLPDSTIEALRSESEEIGTTPSGLIRQIVISHFKKNTSE